MTDTGIDSFVVAPEIGAAVAADGPLRRASPALRGTGPGSAPGL
jgi:hypothetical protein